jgi:hypothetical protein
VEVLRDQRAAQRVERVAAPSWADDRLVFASERGTVLDPANVRRMLKTICRGAELPEINPNELRHSAASLMNDAGTPLELIADVLGHSSTAMLDRHYRHRLRPSAERLSDGCAADVAVTRIGILRRRRIRASSRTERRRPVLPSHPADQSGFDVLEGQSWCRAAP